MKKTFSASLPAMVLAAAMALASCRTGYEVTQAEGCRIPMNAAWDAHPDTATLRLVAPYKAQLDSVMNRVVGRAAQSMDNERPEDLLSNLVADVLRQAAVPVLGHEADMGLVNMGGLRNVLTEGEVTYGDIFEILPFENSLCVLTLKGADLKALFRNIAARGGEGVSGVRLVITADGRLIDATVDGRPVDDDHLYSVATIDYLAEGNDGMTALTQATDRQCPPGATLRNLFLDYVERCAARGQAVSSRKEGRIRVQTSSSDQSH